MGVQNSRLASFIKPIVSFAWTPKLTRFAEILAILGRQSHPWKFLISRLLRCSGLWRLFHIQRKGYVLKLHPATLAMALWIDPTDRKRDSELLEALLRPGDRVVDVGANIGHLSIEAAIKVGQEGVVTAVEAHPRVAQYLRANIRLNGLGNVRIAQLALGSQTGWVHFTDDRADDQNKVSQAGALLVPIVRLDDLLGEEPCTLLKIDVEGYEKYVLEGAAKLLSRVSFIFFEAWDNHFQRFGYCFKDIAELLESRGFSIMERNDGVNRHVSRY